MSALSHSRGLRVLYLLPSCCLGFSLLATPALAENVTWDSTSSPTALQNIPGDLSNVLAPSGSSSGKSASVSGNIITVNGGPNIGNVYGAFNYNDLDAVTNNQVIINSGTITNNVYGGRLVVGVNTGTSTVTGNSVVISGGTVGGSVWGGYIDKGDVTGNSVTISGGAVTGDVYGGQSANGAATNNTVTISGGTVGGNLLGSPGGTGDCFSGNTLNLKTPLTVFNMGNFQHLNFYLPTTFASGGTMLTATYGAYLSENPDGSGRQATVAVSLGDNQIIAPGDTVRLIEATGSVAGLTSSPDPPVVTGTDANGLTTTWKLSADATGLSAFLSSLETNGDLARPGGYTVHSSATDAASLNVGGTLTVGGTGLTLDNSLGGGVNVNVGVLDASATDATVTLTDTAASGVLFHTLNLGNGHAFTMAGNGGYTVNTYNVLGPATFNGNLNATGSTMNFYVPGSMGAGGTMLSVSGAADVSNSTVHVGINGVATPLQAGDHIVLINAGSLTGTSANSVANATGMQGVTLLYNFDITTQGNQLWATLPAAPEPEPGPGPNPPPGPAGHVNPQAKALSEGFVSGAAVVNQSTDFVAGKGMAQAMEAAGGQTPGAGKEGRANMGAGYGLGVFGAVSGGWSRYNTGSNVDMSSLSLMAGLAWGNDLAPGRLTLGAFFEYGNGWYDTYNSFANAADTRGKGNIYHLGGGFLGRLDFTRGFYTEASVRAGGVSNDYKNGDFNGQAAGYDSSSAYYGAHAGLGYVLNLTEKAALDLYGKYFWTRQQGDSLRLSTGDPVRFDDVDSHRLRVGDRFVYAVSDLITPYAGLAYEHEFDGKARATAYGQAINAPSLQGGTGIGEIGLTIKATKDLPLSVDLGVQGYVGTREGVTGSLQIRYDF